MTLNAPALSRRIELALAAGLPWAEPLGTAAVDRAADVLSRPARPRHGWIDLTATAAAQGRQLQTAGYPRSEAFAGVPLALEHS